MFVKAMIVECPSQARGFLTSVNKSSFSGEDILCYGFSEKLLKCHPLEEKTKQVQISSAVYH